MNKSTGLGIVLLLAAGSSPSAFAQGYWKPVPLAQQIQMIQNFEGNPNLQIASDPKYPNQEFSNGVFDYSLNSSSPDYFDRHDRRWESDLAFYGMDDIASLAPSIMTLASAQQIAQDFLQSHFPEPQKVVLMNADADEHGENFITCYRFVFGQDLGNGVRGPVSCNIDVDAVYGRVVDYFGRDCPVLGPTQPTLTANQAIACALAAFAPNGSGQARGVAGVGLTDPDAFGNETISYSILLSSPNVSVAIDGFTGQVLETCS